MKRFGKLLAVLLAAVVLLGGCAFKEDFKFKIKDDKNVDAVILVAYDKEMLDGSIKMNDSSIKDGDITDDMRWNYLEENVKASSGLENATVERYESDGWYGYTYTKALGTLDDLTTEDKNAEKAYLNDKDLGSVKLFVKDGDKYISNIALNKEDSQYKSMDSYKSYGVGFNITLTVELPDKAISNNATEVTNDGKTLSWNLLEAQDINFEFKMPEKSKSVLNKGMITIVAIVVVIIVLFIAIIIVVVALTSNKKSSAPVAQAAPETKPVEEPVVEQPVVEEKVVEEAKEEIKTEEVKVVEEKKAPAKKAPAKKAVPKKTEAKKAAPKKTVTKKPAAKKTTTAKKTTKK